MEIFYILLVLLIVTRACGELAARCQLPPLLGEVLAGIALGIVARNNAQALPILAELDHNEVFIALTDLAIFFLMLAAGLELRPKELVRSSVGSLAVAAGGMLLPFALGMGLAYAVLPESKAQFPQALFLGTALAVTAVPVAIRVLMDMGLLKSRVGQIIVSAAVIDDVFSLLLLTALTAVLQQGEIPDAAGFAVIAAKAALFFVVTVGYGRFISPRLGSLVKHARAEEFEFSILLIEALAYAVLAEILGLHFLLGPFMAGLFFSRATIDKRAFENAEVKVSGITSGFLAPLFFASIGLHLDFVGLVEVPGIVIGVVAAAMIGKVIGSAVPALLMRHRGRDALAIGFAMNGRGAVELIIADVALRAGLFEQPVPVPAEVQYLFSAVVIMAVVTTLLTPVALRLVLAADSREE